ncbi:hypothetical protein D5086_025381 [Populus alba]|uniref:Uncharacterized protein n=1 Tax=Populus alba TaxID=43335 RepID=A0ACC4AZU6_POPAL
MASSGIQEVRYKKVEIKGAAAAAARGHYRNEAPRHEPHTSQFRADDDTRRKRFKVREQQLCYWLHELMVL